MQLPTPEARANISSSSSESDFGSFVPRLQSQHQENGPSLQNFQDKERNQRLPSRGPPDARLPLHVGICRNCRRLYKRSEVSKGVEVNTTYSKLRFHNFRAGRVLTLMICSYRGEERNKSRGSFENYALVFPKHYLWTF